MSSKQNQCTSAASSDEDEEPDYMSDEFLKQCTKNDVRPSLIHNREVKRKIDVLKRQEERNKTRQEAEKARLKSMEESLKTPVSTDNKGFQMLVKMGFKPGSSIGSASDRSGIKEPISIDLKQSRGGLGFKRSEESKRKLDAVMDQGNQEEFRQRKQAASKMREIAADLRKAQFSCQNLDQEAGLENPVLSWYWQKEKLRKDSEDIKEKDNLDALKDTRIPSKKLKVMTDIPDDDCDANDNSDNDNEEDDDVPDDEKLNSIFNYLRNMYFYCLWCGAKFSDSSDLEANCPGMDKDDH